MKKMLRKQAGHVISLVFAGSVSDCQIRFGYLLYGYGADLFRLGLYYFIECRSVGGFGVDVGRADDVDFQDKTD